MLRFSQNCSFTLWCASNFFFECLNKYCHLKSEESLLYKVILKQKVFSEKLVMHFGNEKYLVKYSKLAFHCTEFKCSED